MPVHSCIYRLWLALFLLLMSFQPVPAQVIPAVDTLGNSKCPDICLDEATKETSHTELAVLQFGETPDTKYALDAYRDLSDDAINAGEWTDTDKDTRIRYYINESGIIQVKAFGFRKDLKLTDGKTASLPELASHIKEQTNRFLEENHVNKFDLEAPVFKDDGETFADGRQIVTGGNNAGFIKIVSEGIGLTTTLLKTARIEEDTYLDSPKNEVVIAVPGMGTGTIEAGVKTITDITEPVAMLYDLTVDKKAGTEACNGLVQIRDQVKDDPSSLFPLLGEIILEEFSGNTSEEWQELNRDETDTGRQSHLLSKGAVRTVASVFASGKFLAKVPDMADNLAKKMDNVVKSIGEIKTLLINSGEDFAVLSKARKLPGVASGTGKEITGKWLRGTDSNAGLFPKSVADKLRGRTFNNFDEFRQAFWKEVANDADLVKQFEPQQVSRMKDGLAPYVKEIQQLGGQRNYILHHKTPINQGGGVYDVDNLYIVTPKYHKEILTPAYHYGYGY
jgi:hypothetical protein